MYNMYDKITQYGNHIIQKDCAKVSKTYVNRCVTFEGYNTRKMRVDRRNHIDTKLNNKSKYFWSFFVCTVAAQMWMYAYMLFFKYNKC